MQFSVAAVLALATAVAALPPASGTGAGQQVGHSKNDFPLPKELTTKQAADKCGDQAQLTCCNKTVKTGDFTQVEEGLLAGLLSNLLGAGQGSQGLGLLDECTNIPVIPIISIASPQEQCKQPISCCQNTKSSADGDLIGVGLPCIALGSLLVLFCVLYWHLVSWNPRSEKTVLFAF
ncbi:Hydrophobin [Aspergillus oryzae]|uniref:Hydrophobin n=1 Tax=Aspergillus oryzae TaxID=5062 RepID=A0A1S9DH62_ASPOZ|nr:Hydrophobin [Aspergillus oryzae]